MFGENMQVKSTAASCTMAKVVSLHLIPSEQDPTLQKKSKNLFKGESLLLATADVTLA